MDYVKEILKEETKGLSLNKERKIELIFSYNDVEEMLRELENRLKNKRNIVKQAKQAIKRLRERN